MTDKIQLKITKVSPICTRSNKCKTQYPNLCLLGPFYMYIRVYRGLRYLAFYNPNLCAILKETIASKSKKLHLFHVQCFHMPITPLGPGYAQMDSNSKNTIGCCHYVLKCCTALLYDCDFEIT